MNGLKMRRTITILIFVCVGMFQNPAQAYYTTSGQNVISRKTGEVVQLKGIGLGGWLLPEGYMWGIRKLDRPRQFEAAIEDLIGPKQARRFWDLYYENFVTREDVEIMKSWGVNTLRVPLLASMIQPRDGQPANAPYIYSAHNFEFLDNFVNWCEELGMGIIWDLHGAPGGQNAENISDSDGTARLWTEKTVYWPQTVDLWDKITTRYADYTCIVGYDLLNEPLLARYPGVDPGLLRELYVLLTATIRKTDRDGIIFVEGDDWAQDFSVLEPLDWDPHLVLAFHSYPPTNTQRGLQRWDDQRKKYNIPLWHGETGEQNPPWEIYKQSTHFLESANVGWNWWTHKKFELSRQPWSIHRTEGFEKILAYWNGKGERPSKWQAKRWLFKQARMTNSVNCEFLPGMVESLHPLDPSEYVNRVGIKKPAIAVQPQDQVAVEGYGSVIRVKAFGYPLDYQWYRNGKPIPNATSFELFIHEFDFGKRGGEYHVVVSNEKGNATSNPASVTTQSFNSMVLKQANQAPVFDGELDALWAAITMTKMEQVVSGDRDSDRDLSAHFAMTYDATMLYVLVQVVDDIISTDASIDYMKDGIELYLDGDNSKSAFYDADDFQLRYVVDESVLVSSIGATVNGAVLAQKRVPDGYQMELAIPWEAISSTGALGDFLGLDIHINDNDGKTRHGKLAWYCTRDNAYQSPSVFGTVRVGR